MSIFISKNLSISGLVSHAETNYPIYGKLTKRVPTDTYLFVKLLVTDLDRHALTSHSSKDLIRHNLREPVKQQLPFSSSYLPTTDQQSSVSQYHIMASKAFIPFLIAMMLVTGVCNTLLSKYQDNQCVADCDSAKPKLFEQPVIQTAQMFIGEMGSWLVIGGYSLYNRYLLRNNSPQTNGYAPVTADDTDGPAANPESTDNELSPSPNPIVQPMIANAEGRLPLTGWKTVLLSLPSICDICGTTLMNIGLLFVVASIYQMTRGALVLFVGLFSVLFLKRHLHLFQWFALVTVVLGVSIVGLAGAISKDDKTTHSGSAELLTRIFDMNMDLLKRAIKSDEVDHGDDGAAPVVRTILGVFLIAGAQIFTATQFVLEEFILERYELEPIKVVGWEGIFGFLLTFLGMVVMHFAVGRTHAGHGGYFDMAEGWRQITGNRAIWLSSLATMVSIGYVLERFVCS